MILNSLDLGDSHPWRMPIVGQEIGAEFLEGNEYLIWPRGSIARRQTVTFQLKGWQAMGGAAAFSLAATKYLLKQVEELASNRDMQPVYIQWDATAMPNAALNASDLHDGWYVIDSFEPDYFNYVVTGQVDCRLTVTEVAAAPPRRLAMAYAGGALATNFSGTAKNLLELPYGSTALESAFNRIHGGGLAPPSVLAPVASPEPFVPPTSIANFFKSGVEVYDAINTSVNGVPVAATGTLWHSLGTEAGTDNSMNYWGQSPGGKDGTITYSGHLLSLSNPSHITAAHPDLWDVNYLCRIVMPTTGNFGITIHHNYANATAIIGYLTIGAGNGNLALAKFVPAFNLVAGQGATLTISASTAYWIRVQGTGTTYTVTAYNDSAGALGSQIAQVSGTITDSFLQTGQCGLWFDNGTGTAQAGGAFANVCTVTGPVPTNAFGTWGPTVAQGEPAFCWSKVQSFQGNYSLSVYNATANGQGYWGLNTAVENFNLTVTAAMRGTGTPTAFDTTTYGGTSVTANAVSLADSTWHLVSASGNPGAGTMSVFCHGYGQGTYYFDLVSVTASSATSPFFADSFETPINGNWVQVFSPDHDFQGDCIITNGLQLLLVAKGTAIACYLWNTALATPSWQQYGNFHADNADNTQAYSLTRVGAEEVAASLVTSLGTITHRIDIRLQRGRYEVRTDLTPLTGAVTDGYSIFLALVAAPKIGYNGGAIADAPLGEGPPGVQTDYGYGAAFIANATYPFIVAWLLQNQSGSRQPQIGTSTSLGHGDTAALAINTRRSYAFFAIPYGVSGQYSTADLQINGKDMSMAGGWVSAADGGASQANVAKLPSGTAAGANLNGPTTVPRAVGTYDVWVRARVTSNASGTAQMQIGMFDATASSWIGSTVYAPNQLATTYAWYRTGTAFSIPAGHNVYFAASDNQGVSTNTDWWIDEYALVPKTLTTDNRGPQDIWQQFMYDRSVRLVRN